MAYKEVLRVEIQEVIRRWQAGGSQRQIGVGTGLSRVRVRKCLAAAMAAGLEQDGPPPDEVQLSRLAGISRAGPKRVETPVEDSLTPWGDQIYRWLSGDRLQVTRIHELLAARGCAVSYTSLRRFIQKHNWSRRSRTTVRMAVILIWEASDRICGKRLKAALPHLVDSMERHGHLDLDPEVRSRLLTASAATLDRLLRPVKARGTGRRKRRRNLDRGRHIPIRTFADWNRPPPGYLEIDLVAHCGDNMGGSFVYSLVATDICTGWTEAVPLLAREQSLVVAGLEAIAVQLPFPVRGIDSDNDSVFINDTLTGYCSVRDIEFTRSRAYRKNDQAWVEQKNGAVIRRFLGHERYSGLVAGQTIAHLHQAMRLYVNYFQPSFKLVEKTRNGSAVIKR